MKKNDYASVKADGTIVPKKIGQTEMTVRSTDGTKYPCVRFKNGI